MPIGAYAVINRLRDVIASFRAMPCRPFQACSLLSFEVMQADLLALNLSGGRDRVPGGVPSSTWIPFGFGRMPFTTR